jgi:hypothetical protein
MKLHGSSKQLMAKLPRAMVFICSTLKRLVSLVSKVTSATRLISIQERMSSSLKDVVNLKSQKKFTSWQRGLSPMDISWRSSQEGTTFMTVGFRLEMNYEQVFQDK